jgi:hypothetical protein
MRSTASTAGSLSGKPSSGIIEITSGMSATGLRRLRLAVTSYRNYSTKRIATTLAWRLSGMRFERS